ncbi:penicillin-binding protein 2 [Vannielia sp.]|uniref:penicillin-binding protein 2 n=1 Tax=Vannielia sp. TaxID=2813045 RepID=UPI0026196098|nr:penicillin-binding protein 2 [Vannielia sp.]MDF1871779.1 penicillin-binding protein 2 [Vannielia sp.]
MKRAPKDTEESARRITRRGLIMGGLMGGFSALLVGRMRHLQVDQADTFRLLAEENRIKFSLIPPERGLIFDREGRPLAVNEQIYRVVLVPEDAGDIENTIARLRQIVPLPDEDVEKTLADIRRSSPFHEYTIADRLSWEQLSEVAVNTPALPGISPKVGLSRSYPLAEDFAHVIGYVGRVSDYDLSKLEEPDPLLKLPQFQIGKSGVENKWEEPLRGRAGNRRIEVNAAGRVMRELDRQQGESGADLQLTVDSALQNFVQARLGTESAACVVMDVETGDLVAIGSAPSFDPNLFVRGISVADYKSLTENDHRPLANKAAQGLYPPGSTFKMVTALAALEAGVITPGETFYCRGHKEVAGRRFHCWKRSGHGWVDLDGSLQQSCDVYYYEIALKAGIENISAMAKKLGIGVRHDVPMSAVAQGLAPTKAWKKERYDQDWVIGDSLNASIGQGFVLASPLQLAVMAARIASGNAIEPRLVKSVDGRETEVKGAVPLDISPTALQQVRKGMFNVVNSGRGTARRARILSEGMAMAGKTGTSQVRSVVVRNQDVPWEERDHALFVAFAPYDKPKYALSVVVEHGGGGSTVAAPIARDVMLQALYGGFPPLSAYPKGDRWRVEQMRKELPIREEIRKQASDRA